MSSKLRYRICVIIKHKIVLDYHRCLERVFLHARIETVDYPLAVEEVKNHCASDAKPMLN